MISVSMNVADLNLFLRTAVVLHKTGLFENNDVLKVLFIACTIFRGITSFLEET
mgnify:FL=1